MGKAEEYLANATECVRMARLSKDERDRHTWLSVAESWMQKANASVRDLGPPNSKSDAAD